MSTEGYVREGYSQALVSKDKRAWEAHKKRKEREKLIDTLSHRVEKLETAIAELQMFIKEKNQ